MGHARTLPVRLLGAAAIMILACASAAALGGRETSETREVPAVDGVRLATAGELIVTQGDRESLEITAEAEELTRIVTEVRDGMLLIGRDGPAAGFSLRRPVFRLTMKRIAALETHSSGSISARNIRTDSLRILVSSSGGVSIDALEARALDVRISSSGSVRLLGSVDRQTVLLTSSGDYAGGKLASRTADVRVSSSGSATLRVSDSLEADVTSSGSVRYYGSPPAVKGHVTSSGKLVRLGGER
jgi:hypothetical protein